MTLEQLTSDALHHPHGFFSRKGGASSGIFEGLNCGYGSTDQAEVVAINRSRVAGAMSVADENLVTVHQIHSSDAVHVTGPHAGTIPRADAMVTATPGVALGILTADCQPVLFEDSQAHIVGAAHAGWKGALDGILDATIDAMIALGARRDRITAVIGPSISQTAYEVGPEFFERFQAEDPSSARYFSGGKEDRMHFDLPGYGLGRLRAAGIGHAEWTRHCTYGDPNRFFSYRRSTHACQADYGRLISVIRA